MSIAPADPAYHPVRAERDSKSVHLGYLDSLRGLAAIYVMLTHIVQEIGVRSDFAALSPVLRKVTHLLAFGHWAVVVFIVLSGYCLMIPVAKSADGQLRGGVWAYLKRRARRILPPYYAAVVLSLIVMAIGLPWMKGIYSVWTDDANGSFGAPSLLSHLFLVHNLSRPWLLRINAPLWSVATEWQIYFIFPLLLLPVWRKMGLTALVLTGVVVGTAPALITHYRFEAACFHFIGLFAMGMAAAVLSFRAGAPASPARWGLVSAAVFSLIVVQSAIGADFGPNRNIALDTLVGASFAAFLVFCAGKLREGRVGRLPGALSLLQTPSLIALGAMSYSVYLVHFPIVGSVNLALLHTHLTAAKALLAMVVICPPLVLGAAYLFHLTIERRFMTSK